MSRRQLRTRCMVCRVLRGMSLHSERVSFAETGFPSALLFGAWFITGTADYSFLEGCLC